MAKQEAFKIGDKVLTNISSYEGRIIGINTEPARSHYGSWDFSEQPITTYRVLLPFQVIGSPEFVSRPVDLAECNLRKP